jgi:hypothetical protein
MEETNQKYTIYIIQEREFIRLKEETYKVGITKDIIRRYSEYPKSSKLIYTRVCDTNFEKEILNNLREEFIQKREYGTEYFEGDCNEIINCINKTIDENKNKILEIDDIIIISRKLINRMEKDYMYVCLFLCNIIGFKSNSVLKINDLYSKYKIWHELILPGEKILPISIIKKYIIHEYGQLNKIGNWNNLVLNEEIYKDIINKILNI